MDEFFNPFAEQSDVTDAMALDLDNDGIMDEVGYALDTDGDGIADSIAYSVDTDGDNVDDTLILEVDSDSDGFTDTTVALGELESSNEPEAMDDEADNQPDNEQDDAGDDIIEQIHSALEDDPDEFDEPEDDMLQADEVPEWDQTQMGVHSVQFDPANVTDSLQGTPVEDMQQWSMQEESGPCAIYSQTFAFNGLTGKNTSPDEMEDLARSYGIYTDDGTSMSDMGKLLEITGLDVHMSYGNQMSDITDCWQRGGKTIVSVDSDEIWYGESDMFYLPQSADHAVQVIGLQDEDTDHPMVILNDPGTPNGCGMCVPLETFCDAWEDSGCQLVTVYPPDADTMME